MTKLSTHFDAVGMAAKGHFCTMFWGLCLSESDFGKISWLKLKVA